MHHPFAVVVSSVILDLHTLSLEPLERTVIGAAVAVYLTSHVPTAINRSTPSPLCQLVTLELFLTIGHDRHQDLPSDQGSHHPFGQSRNPMARCFATAEAAGYEGL